MNTPPPSDDGTEEIAPESALDLPANQDGRDEMNLAEYPIALLGDRAPRDVRTLIYKDRDETLTITGSDYLGLPTALDIDVIIGLLYLTKKKNDFTNRTLSFTRYELIQVLQWSHRGRHYERITESLNRWVGVTLIYKRSWWDNDKKNKGNASFHIIDAANVVERDESTSRSQQLPLSTIRWGEEFFRSCQTNNLKRLDLKVYFSLRSSISKQLYRFLDKRFYKKPLWTFDLRTLACEHVGLSRNYASWKLKQKFEPAIEELTRVGFLRRMRPQERYQQVTRGEWAITLAKGSSRPPLPEERGGPKSLEVEQPPLASFGMAPPAEPEPTPLERELISRGVTASTARELVAAYPEKQVSAQIEHFDWLMEKHPKKVKENPGGYLASAIREDYAPQSGFEAKAVRERRRAAEEAQRRRDQDEAQRRKRERLRNEEAARQVKQFWDSLTNEERLRLDAQALANADEETRRQYEEAQPGAPRRLLIIPIRDGFIRGLLAESYDNTIIRKSGKS